MHIMHIMQQARENHAKLGSHFAPQLLSYFAIFGSYSDGAFWTIWTVNPP